VLLNLVLLNFVLLKCVSRKALGLYLEQLALESRWHPSEDPEMNRFLSRGPGVSTRAVIIVRSVLKSGATSIAWIEGRRPVTHHGPDSLVHVFFGNQFVAQT